MDLKFEFSAKLKLTLESMQLSTLSEPCSQPTTRDFRFARSQFWRRGIVQGSISTRIFKIKCTAVKLHYVKYKMQLHVKYIVPVATRPRYSTYDLWILRIFSSRKYLRSRGGKAENGRINRVNRVLACVMDVNLTLILKGVRVTYIVLRLYPKYAMFILKWLLNHCLDEIYPFSNVKTYTPPIPLTNR